MVGSDIEIPEVLETIQNDDNPATSIIQEVLENTVRIGKIKEKIPKHILVKLVVRDLLRLNVFRNTARSHTGSAAVHIVEK